MESGIICSEIANTFVPTHIVSLTILFRQVINRFFLFRNIIEVDYTYKAFYEWTDLHFYM